MDTFEHFLKINVDKSVFLCYNIENGTKEVGLDGKDL